MIMFSVFEMFWIYGIV